MRFYRRIIFICVYNIPIATLFNIWVCEVYFITIVDKQTENVSQEGVFSINVYKGFHFKLSLTSDKQAEKALLRA